MKCDTDALRCKVASWGSLAHSSLRRYSEFSMQHISSASERAPMMCQGWRTVSVKFIHKGCQCEMSYVRPPNVLVLRRRLYSSLSLFCSRLLGIEVRRSVDTEVSAEWV